MACTRPLGIQMASPFSHGQMVDLLGDAPFVQRLLEALARGSGFEAGVKIALQERIEHVPHLGFRFAAQFRAATAAGGCTWSESRS